MAAPQDALDARILSYYAAGGEQRRLTGRSLGGLVELERVRRLVRAHLEPASRILDVGGGTGVHSRWLAADGHRVTLVDPVPEHVEAAARDGSFDAALGDARALEAESGSVDAVLLFGPLYHLSSPADRDRALQEARRVLRPGGLLMAQAITRLSFVVDQAVHGGETGLGPRHLEVLRTGDWHDLTAGFPGGHLHTAAELRAEVTGAGFGEVGIHGVEGPTLVALEDVPADDALLDLTVRLAEGIERRLAADGWDGDVIAGYSAHLLAIGRAPQAL